MQRTALATLLVALTALSPALAVPAVAPAVEPVQLPDQPSDGQEQQQQQQPDGTSGGQENREGCACPKAWDTTCSDEGNSVLVCEPVSLKWKVQSHCDGACSYEYKGGDLQGTCAVGVAGS